jgi:hypothetical protein
MAHRDAVGSDAGCPHLRHGAISCSVACLRPEVAVHRQFGRFNADSGELNASATRLRRLLNFICFVPALSGFAGRRHCDGLVRQPEDKLKQTARACPQELAKTVPNDD